MLDDDVDTLTRERQELNQTKLELGKDITNRIDSILEGYYPEMKWLALGAAIGTAVGGVFGYVAGTYLLGFQGGEAFSILLGAITGSCVGLKISARQEALAMFERLEKVKERYPTQADIIERYLVLQHRVRMTLGYTWSKESEI